MSRDEERDARERDEDDDARALDLVIAEHLKIGLPLATIIGAFAAGFLQGAPAVILVLAGGALLSVIAVFWSSIRTLVGETPLTGADAYAIGSTSAEEEQKRAVLRALKDLEFERSVGKISDEDYHELVAKYRAEAKRLLRILDEDAAPARQKIEELVTKRLFEAGLAVDDDAAVGGYRDSPEEQPKLEEQPKPRKAKRRGKAKDKDGTATVRERTADKPDDDRPIVDDPVPGACAKCGTKNDADAVFCKKCGARQTAEEETES